MLVDTQYNYWNIGGVQNLNVVITLIILRIICNVSLFGQILFLLRFFVVLMKCISKVNKPPGKPFSNAYLFKNITQSSVLPASQKAYVIDSGLLMNKLYSKNLPLFWLFGIQVVFPWHRVANRGIPRTNSRYNFKFRIKCKTNTSIY